MKKNIALLPHSTHNQRLDSFLSAHTDLSRSSCQQHILNGHVTIDNTTVYDKSFIVTPLHSITIDFPPPEEPQTLPEPIDLDVLFEDDDMLVINKPAGMVVHPAPGHKSGTLVNALLHHCKNSLSGINGVKKPGIIHRLDRFTSGAILIAKNDQAHLSLADQIASHEAHRQYVAICQGELTPRSGTINKPIGRHPSQRTKMAISLKGQHATTHYKTIYSGTLGGIGAVSILECTLETGRTHQIRVHMQSMRHPIINDKIYGARDFSALPPLRQALHARRIQFTHPSTNEIMSITAPIPQDLQTAIREVINNASTFRCSEELFEQTLKD